MKLSENYFNATAKGGVLVAGEEVVSVSRELKRHLHFLADLPEGLKLVRVH